MRKLQTLLTIVIALMGESEIVFEPDPTRVGDEQPGILLSGLRLLSHRCWWKDNYCCNSAMTQCRICTDMCQTGQYNPKNYPESLAEIIAGQPLNCGIFVSWDTRKNCIKLAGTPDKFSCLFVKNPATKTFTFYRDGGQAGEILVTKELDFFTSANPVLCGDYQCTSFTRKSGAIMDSCITGPAYMGGRTTFDASTCQVFGSSTYNLLCGADDKYWSTSADIFINNYDYCHLAVTALVHADISYLQFESSGSKMATSPLLNFMTIVLAGNTKLCNMDSCSIVTASDASTCTDTAITHFTASNSGGTTISHTINTSAIRVKSWYCLKCVSNEIALTEFKSLPFEMEVTCASSGYVVSNHASLITDYFHVADGNQPLHPVEAFSSSETSCPVTNVEFYEEDKTTVKAGMGPTSSPDVTQTTQFGATDFSLEGTYKFKIKVTLKGGQVHWANIGANEVFTLSVCGGLETISSIITTKPEYKQYLNANSGTVSPADVVPWFQSSSVLCPIIQWEIEELVGSVYQAYTGNVNIKLVGLTQMIEILTTSSINKNLFVKASSVSGKFGRQEIFVRVCGDEVIGTQTGYQTKFVYDFNTGPQTHTTQVWSCFTNTDAFCDTFSYQMSQTQPSYTVSTVASLDSSDMQVVQTITSGSFPLWIMASTRTPITGFFPITVIVCGYEVIQGAQNPIPSFYQHWNTGSHILVADLDLALWFSNTVPDCVIVKYSLWLYDSVSAVYTAYTGQVSVSGSQLSVDTSTSNLKITLYAKAETLKPVFGYQEFNVQVCKKEDVNLILTSPPQYQYYYQTGSISAVDVLSWFLSNDHSNCPASAYLLEYKDAAGNFQAYTGSVSIVQTLNTYMLTIDTNTALQTTLYVKASTISGKFVRQQFDVRVCGDEVVSVTTGIYSIFYNYDFNIGPQMPATNIHPAFTNLDLFCTINKYSISTMLNAHAVSPIASLDSNDFQTVLTTSPGKYTVYLVAETRTPIGAWYKIDLLICGFETIGVQVARLQSHFFIWNTGTHTLETDLVANWFTNDEPVYCPITTFDLDVWDVPSSLYVPYTTGQVQILNQVATGKYQLDLNTLPSNLFSKFRVTAKTKASINDNLEINVQFCGQETINLSKTQRPEFKYYFQEGSLPTYEHLPEDVKTWFTSSDPNCPVVTYQVGTQINGVCTTPTVSGQVFLKDVGTQKMVGISAIAPVNQVYCVKASTASLVTVSQEFYVRVCGDETITTTSGLYPSFFKYYKGKGNMIPAVTVQPAFYNPDPFCTITTYTMSKTQPTVVPSSIGQVNPNWFQEIVTDTPGTYKFYIHANTRTPVHAYYPITVLICGGEILTSTLGFDPSVYNQWNTGTKLQEGNLMNWFSNTDAANCPIVKISLFTLLDAQSQTFEPFQGSQASVSIANSLMVETTPSNYKVTIYVRAETYAPVIAYQKVDLFVCGQEDVLPIMDTLYYVYDKNSGSQSTQTVNFRNFLWSSSTICPITTWSLHDWRDKGFIDWSQGIVSVNPITFELLISTSTRAHFLIFLKGTTVGQKFNHKQIEILICGGETVVFEEGMPTSLSFEYLRNSGGMDQTHRENPRTFLRLVKSTSKQCLIEVPMTQVMIEQNGRKVQFNDPRVILDLPSAHIQVKTDELFSLDLFIMVRTKNSPPFYIPMKVEVLEMPVFTHNDPPFFVVPDGYTLNYIINQPQDSYYFTWNVTMQSDDHHMLENMTFSSEHFGSLTQKYENLTERPYFSEKSEKSMLSYNPINTLLTIRVDGGLEEALNYLRKIYLIKVNLYDQQGLQVSKTFRLNVSLNYTEPVIDVFISNSHDVEPEIVLLGKIDHISVFGEVDMTLETKLKLRRDLDISKINGTMMDVYVETAEGWDTWREMEAINLNVSWEIRELTQTKMRIQIDFKDPVSISPLLRYDKLFIHFKDVSQLYDIEEGRRRLSHIVQQSTIKGGIQKQMWNTSYGHEIIKAVYIMRSMLIALLAAVFVLSFVLQRPLDRLITMFFDLQLMCYFCLLHVPVPGNVVITSQVMRKFVSFDILKEIGFSQFMPTIYKSDDLDFLGQRVTFGYQSYSIYVNMQTLGLAFSYFIFSTLTTLIAMICKRKFKGVARELVYNLFYGDLLKIFVFGLLELGAASIMSLSDPHLGMSISNLNFSLSVFCVVIAFLLLPIVYIQIMRKNMDNFDSRKFEVRFRRYTFGANLSKKNPKTGLTHILAFLLKRYALLLTAFLFDTTIFQIVILVVLFMLANCHFMLTLPVYGHSNQLIGAFNSCCIVLCYVHLMTFSDWLDKDEQYLSGQSFIVTLAVFILFNFVFIIWDFLDSMNILVLSQFGESFYTRLINGFKTKKVPPPVPNVGLQAEDLNILEMFPLSSPINNPSPPIQQPALSINDIQKETVIKPNFPSSFKSTFKSLQLSVEMEEIKEDAEELISSRQENIGSSSSSSSSGEEGPRRFSLPNIFVEYRNSIKPQDVQSFQFSFSANKDQEKNNEQNEESPPLIRSPEPERKVQMDLKLVDGVWNRLFKRVDQELKLKESKESKESQPPVREKVLLLKKEGSSYALQSFSGLKLNYLDMKDLVNSLKNKPQRTQARNFKDLKAKTQEIVQNRSSNLAEDNGWLEMVSKRIGDTIDSEEQVRQEERRISLLLASAICNMMRDKDQRKQRLQSMALQNQIDSLLNHFD